MSFTPLLEPEVRLTLVVFSEAADPEGVTERPSDTVPENPLSEVTVTV